MSYTHWKYEESDDNEYWLFENGVAFARVTFQIPSKTAEQAIKEATQ